MKSRDELGKLFQEHYKKGLGVEVGVQYGAFSLKILEHWKGTLKCIYPWADPGYEEIYEIAKARLGEERLIRKLSIDAIANFEDESLDFVYIDACHQYLEVKRDLMMWYKKVRSGGIVSGHDYVEYADFGVVQAVNEFIKDLGVELYLTEDDWFEGINFKSWYFIKN